MKIDMEASELIEKTGLKQDQIIVFMRFGSQLYGTNTADSDTDYKGIFMPKWEDILLNRIPKAASYHSKPSSKDAKNTSEDIDIEIYSLHYFIDLACKGETVALDMLNAPAFWPDVATPVWRNLQRKRKDFYTTNLKSFIGYARKQAAKYGIKGSRLNAAKMVCHFLDQKIQKKYRDDIALVQHADAGTELKENPEPRLRDVWEELPEGEHIHKIPAMDVHQNLRIYQVVGKKFQETAKLLYVHKVLKMYYDEYGHRAKLAAENEGIDWKAVSHALRAAMQVCEIFLHGKINYPLRAAPYLLEIKQGKRDYLNEVAPLLEAYIEQANKLAALSDYPEKVDRRIWDRWLLGVLSSKHESDIGNSKVAGEF